LEHKDIAEESRREQFDNIFKDPQQRQIKMWTNAYGMDQFEAALLEEVANLGKERLYLGKKLPRYIKNANLGIKKSKYTQRHYKMV